jgi:hypothetical protein
MTQKLMFMDNSIGRRCITYLNTVRGTRPFGDTSTRAPFSRIEIKQLRPSEQNFGYTLPNIASSTATTTTFADVVISCIVVANYTATKRQCVQLCDVLLVTDINWPSLYTLALPPENRNSGEAKFRIPYRHRPL